MPKTDKSSFIDIIKKDIPMSPFKFILIFIIMGVIYFLMQRFVFNR